MTVTDRVAQLLKDVPIEDQIRGREIAKAGEILGLSTPSVYRLISEGKLGHVKLEGKKRRGRGCAGAVRVRLIDIARFQVENERVGAP